MRQVLSLSLPLDITQQIRMRVKERNFDSISSYVKYLINLDSDLISEWELIRTIKKARLEYQKGQIVKAKSLADLL